VRVDAKLGARVEEKAAEGEEMRVDAEAVMKAEEVL
jgi:hypothetical protein